MGSFSDYWENEILDHIFDKGSYTPPTIYIGLLTQDPLDSGSYLIEPSGNGYARVQTSIASWTTASGGGLNNASDITFPQATRYWGVITHFALFDAASGGSMLAYGVLSRSKTIFSGDTARFAAGDVNVTFNWVFSRNLLIWLVGITLR